jgi:hypothetical protein
VYVEGGDAVSNDGLRMIFTSPVEWGTDVKTRDAVGGFVNYPLEGILLDLAHFLATCSRTDTDFLSKLTMVLMFTMFWTSEWSGI